MCENTKKNKKGKTKKKNTKFGSLYLGNGLSVFLQIWYVDSPGWRTTLQKMWFKLDNGSPRYKSVKMTFSFFLSIYLRCGAPASWAAPHTVVCLDTSLEQFVYLPTFLDNTLDLANCFCTYAKIANQGRIQGGGGGGLCGLT